MSEDRIRIGREELFDPRVEEALAKERALRQRVIRPPENVSLIRRILFESMVYMPLAGILGGLATWLIVEPYFNDQEITGGEVLLINEDPFDAPDGIVVLTLGETEVRATDAFTSFEEGADGQPALGSLDDVQVGDHLEVAGETEGNVFYAAGIRRATEARATERAEHARAHPGWFSDVAGIVFFPLAGTLIAFALLFGEGATSRNWVRMLYRTLLGSTLALAFSFLAALVGGAIYHYAELLLFSGTAVSGIQDLTPVMLILHVAARSAVWAGVGAATGVGMNLVRSTRGQLRNSVIGGALGGAVGGLFFDPIDRFSRVSQFEGADISRLVGILAVGVAIGVFMALVERLAREAWVRVRTGPLAGKSFILFKTPTMIGSSPGSDIYLYKDAEIDGSHAAIHRVGTTYELEDLNSRMGTTVAGQKIRRRRLSSGDQVSIGNTVLEFEERQKRKAGE